MEELIKHIRSVVDINDGDLSAILTHFNKRTIAKGKYALKQGHIANEYFFIKSGALRIYFDRDEKEYTGWIAVAGDFFSELTSIRMQIPSRYNIQAVEETEVICIKNEKMELLYKTVTAWQQFGRITWENAFLKVVNGILSYQTMTAEERYLVLMQDSDLLQRIPLKELSSYLGITPNSLSRLRKNIR